MGGSGRGGSSSGFSFGGPGGFESFFGNFGGESDGGFHGLGGFPGGQGQKRAGGKRK